MYRMYKYRLCPNKTQLKALASSLETHRRLYNSALEDRIAAYKNDKKTLRCSHQYKTYSAIRNQQIDDLKNGKDGPHWMAHISAVSMRDTIARLDLAFDAFFRRLKNGEDPGFPRFRGRDRYDSIPFNNYNSGCVLLDPCGDPVFCDSEDGVTKGFKLKLFGIGKIRVRLHRPIQGKIKAVVVKREGVHWFVVFSCDLGPIIVEPSKGPCVGIDVGLESFYTTSNGRHEKNPRYLKSVLPKLRRQQRSLSRKRKKSKNREKCKRRLVILHTKVKNNRKEHHYKASLKLIRRFGTICVENLNVKDMIKNGKFSRSIGDAGWSSFISILKCKAESAGVRVISVEPRGTSQECSQCGQVVNKDIRERMHKCPHCGLKIHRDVNAARNILARGLARTEPAEVNVTHKRKRPPRSSKPSDIVCRERSSKMAVHNEHKTDTSRRASDKLLTRKEFRCEGRQQISGV